MKALKESEEAENYCWELLEKQKSMFKGMSGQQVLEGLAIPFVYGSHELLDTAIMRDIGSALNDLGFVDAGKLTRSKEEKLPMWRDMCMVFGIEIPETDDGDAGRKTKKPKLPDPGNIDYSKYC